MMAKKTSPTNAIEWYEERPDGRIIEDLSAWKTRTDDLFNSIHSAFFELNLYTGFRKAEALALEWKNIHDTKVGFGPFV
ncbi:MAG: hypothetical protein ACSHXD_15300 [Marinosulfonomonas sp.]